MSRDVFISHSSDDKDIAQNICAELEERGIDVWIAPRDIPAGRPWDEAIIDAIQSANGVLFLLSENANQSKQTKREVQIADESDKPIIPVTIDGSEPSERFKYYLATIQWIEVEAPPTETEYEIITRAISTECDVEPDTSEIASEEFPSSSDWGSLPYGDSDETASPEVEKSPSEEIPLSSKQDSGIQIWVPRLYLGFGIALLSALTWGTGNVVTRWTSAQLPRTSFDIAVLKYVLAGIFLIISGFIIKQRHEEQPSGVSYRPKLNNRFMTAAFFKGINTYSWILASTLIPAGFVATLENLHVVWTSLLLIIVFARDIPGTWFGGAVIVVTGAALITEVGVQGLASLSEVGLLLAVVSGVAFALFTVIWTGEGERPDKLWERSIEMGVLLLTAAIAIYPLHILVSQFWLGGSLLPLTEIPPLHAIVQAINGLIGIGVTYFLMNEALSLTRNLGRISSLLVAIGLSFAVPFTMVVEFFVLDVSVSSIQMIGVVLFIAGFTAVRAGILERSKEEPEPTEQPG